MSAKCQQRTSRVLESPDRTPLPVAPSRILADLEAVEVAGKSLFAFMPQKPDGLRILD